MPASTTALRSDIAIAVLRATTGTIFTAHGAQKLFVHGFSGVTGAFAQMGVPFPQVAGPATALVEFFGGLALIIGLQARLAGLGLALTMLGAIGLVHLAGGFLGPDGIEFPLALLGAAVAVAFRGAGRFSLDSLITNRRIPILALAVVTALVAPSAAYAQNQAVVLKPQFPPPAMERQAPAVERNLKTFDMLDFDVFSNQKWDRLHESHAKDIIVTWPDGHETKGIDAHIADLKALFVYAPDIEIKVHPIRFGSGEWTAVTGVMTGTFTKPMPIGEGKFIQPTGKRFALPMATIGHWTNGTMDHEWLFWDGQEFMKQLGLAK